MKSAAKEAVMSNDGTIQHRDTRTCTHAKGWGCGAVMSIMCVCTSFADALG